ncbi:MAG TPA: hypothetical protein VKK79_19515 [Candidatus Lokiarchaeia archaeon]|nr:hypothetical protein [Candidatus Lokiarchaeia archaeon]
MEATEWESNQTELFAEQLQGNKNLQQFKQILLDYFASKFPSIYPFSPARIEFSIFQDPDANFTQPKVEISLPQAPEFDRTALNHAFIASFKDYLASRARSVAEFVQFRKFQRHFMILFEVE